MNEFTKSVAACGKRLQDHLFETTGVPHNVYFVGMDGDDVEFRAEPVSLPVESGDDDWLVSGPWPIANHKM